MGSKVDYYKVLGVSSTSGHADIERAYKKKAIALHPDKNKSANATEKFQELSAAYATLGDAKGRREYDSKHLTEAKNARNRQTERKDDAVESIIDGFMGGMLGAVVNNAGPFLLSAMKLGKEYGPELISYGASSIQGATNARPRSERVETMENWDSESSGAGECMTDEETEGEVTEKTSTRRKP